MRILVDYRPALRARTGVGEYVHNLVRAYTSAHSREAVVLFTSSWKDRPDPCIGRELQAHMVDRRIPVRVLNYCWHRLEWPPVEWLAGACDVVHAAHPLLIPARRAAQVVTIHDLYFLTEAAGTRAEIRRDYAALVADHARRAHAVVTSTVHGRSLIAGRLGVSPDHIYVCPPGAPVWPSIGHAPRLSPGGYLLFVGSLEPRKNVGTLLDAYEHLLAQLPAAPDLVLAGRATPDAAGWLARLARPPLAGRARHVGYVDDDRREGLYAGARALVLPSWDEGFGLPALEAMSAGVPVVASNRGALPEVVGSGGTLLDPADPGAWAAALARLVTDDQWATAQAEAGLARARAFRWEATVQELQRAYTDAVARRTGHAHRH